MLSFSSVASLSVKLKELKCGPCNKHNRPLWVISTPLLLCLILWFMPLSQLLWSKVKSSSNNNKKAGLNSSQSGTSLSP